MKKQAHVERNVLHRMPMLQKKIHQVRDVKFSLLMNLSTGLDLQIRNDQPEEVSMKKIRE